MKRSSHGRTALMPIYAKISCALPDDPKMIEAGDLAELLYLRCTLRSREALSDGVIDRRRLARWGAGIRGSLTKLAARLVEVGLWEIHPDGWRVPDRVWRQWNPTAEEIKEIRAAKKEAGERGNHERHHIAKGIHSPKCRYCIADASQGANPKRDDASRKRSPEPEPEPEGEREKNNKAHAISPNGSPAAPPTRTAEACALISDFYSRWVGPEFKPPLFRPDEVDLATEILAAFGNDLGKAKSVQQQIIESMRKNFAGADRFKASEVAWGKKLAAIAKESKAGAARARQSEAQQTANRKLEAAADKSKTVHDATLPHWNALSADERKRFRSNLPPIVRDNEFLVVLAYADSLEATRDGPQVGEGVA